LGVARSVARSVGSWVGSLIGSGIDRLGYFVFTSSFSYGLKGSIAATSLVRVLRPTPGVGGCSRSAVPWAPFFNLGDGE
jgi:hypothetical protein